MKELLRLDQLSYSYDGDSFALSNINLTLYSHEKVAILGNNGGGKSTLFLCCNGVLTPTSGQLSLQGQSIGAKRTERLSLRKAVGLVFQDPDSQILAGSVEAEVSFGPMNLKLPINTVKQRVNDALSAMDLEDFRHRAPQYLSGGEKKRVSIADVLAMEPELLLLDEPGASLDPANQHLLEDTLDSLTQKGLGLVIATHDLDFAWRWADRILLLSQGKLMADGTPEEIFAQTDLLTQCNLSQPLLYQVGQQLGMQPLPRTIKELEQHPRQNRP